MGEILPLKDKFTTKNPLEIVEIENFNQMKFPHSRNQRRSPLPSQFD